MGIRPLEFWKQTPRETFDFVTMQLEKERQRDREEWKRIRMLITYVVNMAGKTMKHNIKETDIIMFPDEYEIAKKEASPEVQRKRALRNIMKIRKEFPGLLKLDKHGRPVIYGEKKKDN